MTTSAESRSSSNSSGNIKTMATLICFGHQDGRNEIEISPPEKLVSQEERLSTTDDDVCVRPENLARNRKEGAMIRLIHSQPLKIMLDNNNSERIHCNDTNRSTATTTRSNKEDPPIIRVAAINPSATTGITPPSCASFSSSNSSSSILSSSRRRMPNKVLLAAIDQLQDAVNDSMSDEKSKEDDNLPTTEILPPNLATPITVSTGSGISPKRTISKLLLFGRRETSKETIKTRVVENGRIGNKGGPKTPSRRQKTNDDDDDDGKVKLLRTPVRKMKQGASTPSRSSPALRFDKTRTWDLFSRKNKKRASDRKLLLPNKSHEDWFLANNDEWDGGNHTIGIEENKTMDSTDSSVVVPPTTVSSKGDSSSHDAPKKKKFSLGRFLRRRRKASRKISNQAQPLSFQQPSDQDVARDGLSLEREERQTVSMSETELIDRLVKECDQNAFLEEGFICLQERLRSRSLSRSLSASRDTSRSSGTQSNSRGDFHPRNGNHKKKNGVSSTSFEEMRSSPARGDPHNDSLPSLASIEEFLSSGPNDSAYSASLEALNFDKELEKLTSDELAELLDFELEQLVREGVSPFVIERTSN